MKYEGRFAGTSRDSNLCTGPDRHPCLRQDRYCPLCGKETVFFRKGLLRDWKDVLYGEKKGFISGEGGVRGR